MYVSFVGDGWSPNRCAEIEDAIKRISVGEGRACWPKRPDEVIVERALRGGRSASDVLQVTVVRDSQRVGKVVKVGPRHELVDALGPRRPLRQQRQPGRSGQLGLAYCW